MSDAIDLKFSIDLKSGRPITEEEFKKLTEHLNLVPTGFGCYSVVYPKINIKFTTDPITDEEEEEENNG